MTLATLIQTAYAYEPWEVASLSDADRGTGFVINRVYGLGVEDGLRVRGGPAWVRTDRYSIDAVAADAANAAAMSGPMLKALLEERFHLQAHLETEQVLAYSLVIAPGGLKLKPASPGSCERRPRPTPGQPLVRRPIDLDAGRRGAKPPCDIFGMANGPNYCGLVARCRSPSSAVRSLYVLAAFACSIGPATRTTSTSSSSS